MRCYSEDPNLVKIVEGLCEEFPDLKKYTQYIMYNEIQNALFIKEGDQPLMYLQRCAENLAPKSTLEKIESLFNIIASQYESLVIKHNPSQPSGFQGDIKVLAFNITDKMTSKFNSTQFDRTALESELQRLQGAQYAVKQSIINEIAMGQGKIIDTGKKTLAVEITDLKLNGTISVRVRDGMATASNYSMRNYDYNKFFTQFPATEYPQLAKIFSESKKEHILNPLEINTYGISSRGLGMK